MSSSRIIIVARNLETDELEFPLDDMTLYGTGEEKSVLDTCRRAYGEQWVLALYEPTVDGWFIGTRSSPQTIDDE